MREIGEIGLIGIFGLIIGSFLNVLIWRLNDPKAPKFWQGRSICPQCKHQIAWFDNLPLLSYLLLRGRCRSCKKPISWQYPLVEFLTGIFFVLAWVLTPGLGILGKLGVLGIAAALEVIFFSDLIYGFIPDEMLLVIGILKLIENWKLKNENWGLDFLAGLIAMLLFYLIYKITKERGLGFGDVKFAFLMGFLLGWPKIAVGLWVAFVSGGLVAIILLALRRTKLSATMALGPFLVIGTFFAALWTNTVLTILGLTP
ncbi:prepilin peptidase [Patescibacteria group bacterium]|nr:prepilin peptidase [Patescibacteria group bacterium]